MQTDYDILIIGGGLVGASLASALGNKALRVGVVDEVSFTSLQQPSFDARTVALAYGSAQIFAAMGLWHDIEELGVVPIKRIHVSDRGHIGATRLDSETQGVSALGYVVENCILGQVLGRHLQKYENVDLICPANLIGLEFLPQRVQVTLTEQRAITTRLLVAADGGNSLVRKLTGVKAFTCDYGQSAVIANVSMERAHNNVAYERFTDTGPLALLPTSAVDGDTHRCAVVWTVRNHQAEDILALDDAAFMQQLQIRFGQRLGAVIKASQRHVYPITLVQAQEHVRSRLAFIGNAAHTLHPVAGQGFNLGLRDVAALAEVLLEGMQAQRDPGELRLLKTYAKWRQRDYLQAALFTDGLVRLFSTTFAPLVVARDLGLIAVDMCPPIKSLLARHAMGFVGKLPRLARGLALSGPHSHGDVNPAADL